MQFSFRQQSGPATTTNLQHQPSFDKSKKIDDIVINKTDLKQSKTITVPTVQTTTSAPTLPTKANSFDDRDTLLAATKKSSSSQSKKSYQIAGGKSMECTSTSGEFDMELCKKSNENISENIVTNISQTNISVILSTECDVTITATIDADTTNTEQILLDDTKVHSECERKSISASPPTITVLCAPCTDVILAEKSAACQSIVTDLDEKIECDADNLNENAQIESSKTDNDDDDNVIVLTPHLSSPIPQEPIQLMLDVKKCDDKQLVAGSQDDLSPSMDEYQECCPTTDDYKYDAVTAAEMIEPGCVAPAPTPSPLIAPLAEDEFYPPDDDVIVSEKVTDEPPAITIDDQCAKTQPSQQKLKKKKQKSSDKGLYFAFNARTE